MGTRLVPRITFHWRRSYGCPLVNFPDSTVLIRYLIAAQHALSCCPLSPHSTHGHFSLPGYDQSTKINPSSSKKFKKATFVKGKDFLLRILLNQNAWFFPGNPQTGIVLHKIFEITSSTWRAAKHAHCVQILCLLVFCFSWL